MVFWIFLDVCEAIYLYIHIGVYIGEWGSNASLVFCCFQVRNVSVMLFLKLDFMAL